MICRPQRREALYGAVYIIMASDSIAELVLQYKAEGAMERILRRKEYTMGSTHKPHTHTH